MTPEFKSVMQQAAAAQSLSFKDVSRFTPTDIRLGIQWLMAEEQNDLAQALADAGIAIYPHSEDILAMAGLLAMTREDWSLAIELLQDLIDCKLQLVYLLHHLQLYKEFPTYSKLLKMLYQYLM